MLSSPPFVVGKFALGCDEFMYVQYLPIRIGGDIRIPPQFKCFMKILDAAINFSSGIMDSHPYIYLTAKKFFVQTFNQANRPGWHLDGYGTDDINFICYDSHPTEFCIGQNFNLSEDHAESLAQMDEQADPRMIKTFPANTLLRIDSKVVHRVSPSPFSGVRTFIKVSLSRHQYNLVGNAHNYLFEYSWAMQERTIARNHPIARKT